MRGRFRMSRFLRALRSERGIAMPTVLMMIIAGLGLGGSAVIASVNAQQTSTRDQSSKEALAAADAAVQLALYRQNKVVTSETYPCVVPGIGGDLVAGSEADDGWCQEVTGTVGDSSYAYRVRPATVVGELQNEDEVRVVAIGASDGVSRRISAGARANNGRSIFGDGDLVGLTEVELGGKEVTGDVGSNGDVTNGGYLCGTVTHGQGHSFHGTISCPGYSVGEGEFNLPPPLQGSAPPSAGGVNSNSRMFSGGDTKSGSVGWDPVSRVLTLTGNATVTLGGSLPYSFCRIDMQGNSQLIAANGATVTILFDTPENCGQTASGGSCASSPPGSYRQLDLTGNSTIVATSDDPKDFSFLFAGSEQCPTDVHLTGNAKSENELVIYGPLTDVVLWGSASFEGAIAGKTVTMGGASKFTAIPDINDFDVSISKQFHRHAYVECAGQQAMSPPDANCVLPEPTD